MNKREIIKQYLDKHPNAKTKEIADATGIGYHTCGSARTFFQTAESGHYRIPLFVGKDTAEAITAIATKEKKSDGTVARELIEKALKGKK